MNQTALITGTTSGIGEAFCQLMASKGHPLILVSRNGSAMQAQAVALQKTGVAVYTICQDLALPGAAQAVFAEVEKAGLTVDILLNNAGFNVAGDFANTPAAQEAEMVQLHIGALNEMVKLFLPGMIERHQGRICTLGSIASYIPCPSDAVYAATKAYILSFSNALHQELKGTGVTVTCLCPGATNTLFAPKSHIESSALFTYFTMAPMAVAQLGYRKMMQGRRQATVGLHNKLALVLTRFAPTRLVAAAVERLLK